MARFEVEPKGSRYQVIDNKTNRACMYTGAPTNPPKYVGDGHKLKYADWGNFYSANGFAKSLERENSK